MAMVYSKKDDTVLDKAMQQYLNDSTDENKNALIRAATGLIYYFIKLYGAGRSENDLYQVGVEGLLKALSRYRSEFRASFTTYAAHCIMGEIRHYVRKEASYYKPGCIMGLQAEVEKEIDRVLKSSGKVPSVKDIADKLNITAESVHEVMRAGMVRFEDLDKAKLSSQRYENFKLPLEDRVTLAQAFKKLDDIQKKVIYMLFFKGMTQMEAASALGFNQRKISRIKDKSLEILKDELL